MKVKSMERRVFTDGNRSFSYDFLRKSIKNINIRIHPDGRVAVSAPEKLPEERRQISLNIFEKSGHLLMLGKNPTDVPPVFSDDVPVTKKATTVSACRVSFTM